MRDFVLILLWEYLHQGDCHALQPNLRHKHSGSNRGTGTREEKRTYVLSY